MSVLQVSVDGHAVRVRIDRPDKRNALSLHVSHALDAALTEHQDTRLPVVLSSSTPGMFLSGTDIRSLRERRGGRWCRARRRLRAGHGLRLPRGQLAIDLGPA